MREKGKVPDAYRPKGEADGRGNGGGVAIQGVHTWENVGGEGRVENRQRGQKAKKVYVLLD